MNDNENKKPSQKLNDLFQQHDTLLEMRKADDIDDTDVDTMYRELTAGLNNEFESLAKSHPELTANANPAAARLQAIIRKIQQAKEGKTFDPATYDYVPTDLKSANYGSETIFETHLSVEDQERLNEMYTGMLSSEIIDDYAEQVHSPREAADKLGIEEKDVERSYGMLSAIEDGFVDGDGRIEYIVLDLTAEKLEGIGVGETIEGGEDGGQSSRERIAALGNFVDKKYLGRVRYSAESSRLSLVLDVVPPAANNAAFVQRGDDGRLDSDSYIPKTKSEAHANGRKLLHTKTGEAGLLRRINKALTMPFDHFLNKDKYRLD